MSDFSKKFIESQKMRLLEEKQRIQENFRVFTKESRNRSSDEAKEDGDIAERFREEKVSISLREKDLRTLREIDVALRKMDDGTYGYCEESGEPIELKRLEKKPWARLSLEQAELLEKESNFFHKKAI